LKKQFNGFRIIVKTAVLLFIGLFFSYHPAFSQGGPGTTGAVELKIPVGPRAIAMGQAFVAVADDANAIYWNPAGLNQLGGTHITAQYASYLSTETYDFLAAATKLGNNAAVGVGAKIVSAGPPEQANDSNGNPIQGEFLTYNYMDIDLAAAYRLSYYFDVGLTAKYIDKSLVGTSASTFAVDIGVLYKTPIPHFTAGLDIQNLGPGIKFDQVTDPLPFNVKVGVAYRMFDDNFTTAFDMNFPNDNAISASLGGEYWYKDTLVGRFGYQFQGSIDQNQVGIGGKAGLYLGAGIKVAAFKDFIGFDYAWTDDGLLGAENLFALDFYF
jgi:long-subunit fatty acid transport protein